MVSVLCHDFMSDALELWRSGADIMFGMVKTGVFSCGKVCSLYIDMPFNRHTLTLLQLYSEQALKCQWLSPFCDEDLLCGCFICKPQWPDGPSASALPF